MPGRSVTRHIGPTLNRIISRGCKSDVLKPNRDLDLKSCYWAGIPFVLMRGRSYFLNYGKLPGDPRHIGPTFVLMRGRSDYGSDPRHIGP